MLNKLFKNYVANNNSNSSLISYKTANITSLDNYQELAEIGYKKNVIVYRCVHLISRAVSSVDWILKKANDSNTPDDVIYNHKTLDIIKKPNATQYSATFMEAATSYLLLCGNCYIMVVRDENNNPKELHLLRPDRVKIIPGANTIPLGYEYNVGDSKQIFGVEQETGFSDVLHLKLFNPLDDWYGMSPIEVAKSSIAQHNAIAQQNSAYLHNGGRPSGALMYKSNLDQKKRNDLRSDLKSLYEGGRNAGKILILEGDFEWKEMGLSPKDLDFIAGKDLSAKEIATAFGVPPILIGSMSTATFSNYKEARYNFWEETVIPILNLFAGELSNWFKRLFKTEYLVWYDIDSIQALSKRREAEWRKISAAEFLTDNEKREAFGYPSLNKTQTEAPPN
ncbi:MAG: phage portal protein [Holosporales bacterium]|jgi:HK97 family phage portal protein|nr:phage portal protein [Holosporales bacterium]